MIPDDLWALPHDERMAELARIESPLPQTSREIHLTGDVVSLLRLLEITPDLNLGDAIHARIRDVKLALTRYGVDIDKPFIVKALPQRAATAEATR